MSKLKVNEIEPTTGDDLDVASNVQIGTDDSPKTLNVKGNVILEANLSIIDDTSTGVLEIDNDNKKVSVQGLTVVDDPGAGEADTLKLTNVKDDSLDTGTGTILLKGSGTTQDSAGFLKLYIGTQVIYIPYFTDITGS